MDACDIAKMDRNNRSWITVALIVIAICQMVQCERGCDNVTPIKPETTIERSK